MPSQKIKKKIKPFNVYTKKKISQTTSLIIFGYIRFKPVFLIFAYFSLLMATRRFKII